MELQQLRYFAKVAELQNITKASQQLYVSQPALSKSIRQLETELDTQLFLRKGKNIYLTECGEIFYARVLRIIDNVNSAKRELAEQKNLLDIGVRLKVRALSGLMPDILTKFHEKWPDIRFSLFHGGELNFPEGKYDLVIYPIYDNSESRSKKLLMTERILVAVSESEPLSSKDVCSLNDLREFPYIHTTKNRFFWETLENLFIEHEFSPNVSMYCDDPNAIIDLVRRGLGISMLPQYSVDAASHDGVRLIPLAEEGFSRSVFIRWSEGAYLPKSTQLFYQFIRNYVKSLK
jgi:LysR family transcriptional activator of glutamate synthase operon